MQSISSLASLVKLKLVFNTFVKATFPKDLSKTF